jgi:hypothetical protein
MIESQGFMSAGILTIVFSSRSEVACVKMPLSLEPHLSPEIEQLYIQCRFLHSIA